MFLTNCTIRCNLYFQSSFFDIFIGFPLDGEETAFKNVFRLDEEKINANLKQSLEEIQKVASESEERIKSSIDLDSDMDLDGDGKGRK